MQAITIIIIIIISISGAPIQKFQLLNSKMPNNGQSTIYAAHNVYRMDFLNIMATVQYAICIDCVAFYVQQRANTKRKPSISISAGHRSQTNVQNTQRGCPTQNKRLYTESFFFAFSCLVHTHATHTAHTIRPENR